MASCHAALRRFASPASSAATSGTGRPGPTALLPSSGRVHAEAMTLDEQLTRETDEGASAAAPPKPPRWRRWLPAIVVVILVVAAAVGVAVWGDDDEGTVTSPSTTDEPATTVTTAPATTAPATATSAPTTATPGPTTSVTSAPTTAPAGTVPGAPTLQAYPGGGSGEIVVRWNAVPGATGYRVQRSATAGGGFTVAAEFDVTTGATTAVSDVVNIWSAGHSYLPDRGALGAPDSSPWFEYVEAAGARRACFRLAATNAAGAGPYSAAACSQST